MRVVAAALEISERRLRDVGLQLGALAARLVELEVQAQHGDVDRHDAGEQRREQEDPEDAAAERPRALARGGTSSWRPRGLRDRRHQMRTAARSRAEPARGL